MSTAELELDPVYTEILTPERFAEVFTKREGDIESVTVVPARLGRGGFGKLVVKFKNPVYKHRLDRTKQEDE